MSQTQEYNSQITPIIMEDPYNYTVKKGEGQIFS